MRRAGREGEDGRGLFRDSSVPVLEAELGAGEAASSQLRLAWRRVWGPKLGHQRQAFYFEGGRLGGDEEARISGSPLCNAKPLHGFFAQPHLQIDFGEVLEAPSRMVGQVRAPDITGSFRSLGAAEDGGVIDVLHGNP